MSNLDVRAFGLPADPGSLFEVALTHRSFAFEKGEAPHNERLEFLGDAILGAIVTTMLYKAYPQLSEGEMARLRASVVNTHALAQIARLLRLGDHLRLGKGELASGGSEKESLLANAFEALVGALYLERGMDVVRDTLAPLFEPRIKSSAASSERFDAKTALQEVVVRAHGDLPSYRLASWGPDHSKEFTATVFVGGEVSGVGKGTSKKEAEQAAARAALERFGAESSPAGDVERGEHGARAS